MSMPKPTGGTPHARRTLLEHWRSLPPPSGVAPPRSANSTVSSARYAARCAACAATAGPPHSCCAQGSPKAPSDA